MDTLSEPLPKHQDYKTTILISRFSNRFWYFAKHGLCKPPPADRSAIWPECRNSGTILPVCFQKIDVLVQNRSIGVVCRNFLIGFGQLILQRLDFGRGFGLIQKALTMIDHEQGHFSVHFSLNVAGIDVRRQAGE